jgi:hypothetical protein
MSGGGQSSFTVPRVTGHRGSTDGVLTHAGAYDDAGDDGHCLMMWKLLPSFTEVGSDYPSHHSVAVLVYPVLLDLNSTGRGGRSARQIEVGVLRCSRSAADDGAHQAGDPRRDADAGAARSNAHSRPWPRHRMTMSVIAAVALFERDLLVERTQAGLDRGPGRKKDSRLSCGVH